MIRRISRHNDLVDYVRSCPSGVIDDVYKIEYYIQGYNSLIECNFTKKGHQLEVIIPTSQLETLPNGILMRRAYYKVVDSSYPDGYYNLEFEDCMNIWLGENESEEPVNPEYVTEDELASTLSSYATQEWVSEQGFVTASTMPSDIATHEWVGEQGYITSSALSGYATEQWVSNELIPYAQTGWVEGHVAYALNGYGSGDPYVTQSWVENKGYITSSALSGYATESWVENKGYITTSALSGYATESWVGEQGYITSSALSGYATESWVESSATIQASNVECNVSGDIFDFSTVAQGLTDLVSQVEDNVFSIGTLDSRVSDLETYYGDAITITNTILS